MESVRKYDLMGDLFRIAAATGQRFIFIIDEWDAICREFAPDTKPMDEYVNWLRRMFKDVSAMDVFAGVYMTGILPIKKYKTQYLLTVGNEQFQGVLDGNARKTCRILWLYKG